MINLWTVFITGLFTGGLSCLAVQGGLLAATLAQQEEEKLKSKLTRSGNVTPILSFLIAKLASYTVLGFLLGWFGSFFQISLAMQVAMQFIVVFFMTGTALNMLEVHPVFRYFSIQPPRFITKFIRNKSKSKSIFAPAMLGMFTVFIPCGVTQAMMALAIGSANPILGALILFTFTLGTSPLFFVLGFLVTKFGENLQKKFTKVAALTLLVLAVINLNSAIALTGSSWTLENIFSINESVATKSSDTNLANLVDILIENQGYNPSNITVKAGQDVTFNIINKDTYTCASAFTIPYFNYQKVVEAGKTESIKLKMPNKETQIPFMCSMGMYRGVINVVL